MPKGLQRTLRSIAIDNLPSLSALRGDAELDFVGVK